MDEIRLHIVEQAFVMRHQNDGAIRCAQVVDPAGNNAQGVDVESRIRFVQECVFGKEHRHLQNLVALFFPARKAVVQSAGAVAFVHFQKFHGGVQLPVEFLVGNGSLIQVGTLGVYRHAQKFHVGNSGDFYWVLGAGEKAFVRPGCGIEFQQILAVHFDGACVYFVCWMSADDFCQSTFSGAVESHDGVNFTGFHVQVDALKNRRSIQQAGFEIFDRKHGDSNL